MPYRLSYKADQPQGKLGLPRRLGDAFETLLKYYYKMVINVVDAFF
jgi:hypothetical protein